MCYIFKKSFENVKQIQLDMKILDSIYLSNIVFKNLIEILHDRI